MPTAKMSGSHLGLLFVVNKREARLLRENKCITFIRKTFPLTLLKTMPIFTYFVEKGSNGRIVATGECVFAMHTMGEKAVLARAHLLTHEFNSRFSIDKELPIAWDFEKILPYNQKKTIYDFVQVVSEKKTFKPVTSIPRGWAYVLC